MTFDDRLKQAIERGHKRSEFLAREAAAKEEADNNRRKLEKLNKEGGE